MPIARPRDTPEVSWPTSTEILRFVARALAVDDPDPILALKGKQLQRFFRGRLDQIDCKTACAILVGLVDRHMVRNPTIVRAVPVEGHRESSIAAIARALAEHMDAWDEFARRHEAHYRDASEVVRRRALVGQLRLAAVDLGVYYGHVAVKYDLAIPSLSELEWNVLSGQDRILRNGLRLRKRTRADLAEALGMHNRRAVDQWCDKGTRPKDIHLLAIARALLPDPEKQRELGELLIRHFARRQLVNDLAVIVGWEVVQDLLAAALRFARGTVSYLTSTQRLQSLRPRACQEYLDRWMRSAPSASLSEHLLVQETSRRWCGVLRGLRLASARPQHMAVELPDGRRDIFIRYPRAAMMTMFDAVTLRFVGEETAEHLDAAVTS